MNHANGYKDIPDISFHNTQCEPLLLLLVIYAYEQY